MNSKLIFASGLVIGCAIGTYISDKKYQDLTEEYHARVFAVKKPRRIGDYERVVVLERQPLSK